MKAGASIRRIVLAILAVIVLFAAGLAIWNSHGKSAWEKTRRALEARGECLDWREFVPPPVPDDQNFAMTPLFDPLFDYVGDGEGHLLHRDTNAVARIERLFDGVGFLGCDWRRGKFADFYAWQRLLRGSTNDAVPAIQDEVAERTPAEPATAFTNQSVTSPEFAASLEPLTGLPIGARPVSLQEALREDKAVAAWLESPPTATAADDLLGLLQINSAELNELRSALRRPYSRFNLNYEQGYEILLPHLGIVKKFALTFRARALAELATGKPADALDDILAGLSLGDTVKKEPLLISGLVRVAITQIMIQPVWEGLARGQWNGKQLAVIQSRLEKINLVEDIVRALRGQRAIDINAIDTALRRILSNSGMPPMLQFCFNGWIQKNQATFAKAFQDYALPPFDPTNRTVDLPLSVQLTAENVLQAPTKSSFFSGSLFVRSIPNVSRHGAQTAQAQATLHQSAIACALERFRLATGAYPERLDQLSPDFMEHVPCDPVNAEPLKYHRTDDGQFVLYSVGWNRADDGGQYVLDRSEHVIKDKSDWVWRYPAKQHAVTVEH